MQIVQDYADWLAQSPIPKLLIVAEPGAILRGPMLDFCRTWPNQREVGVKGVHFIQEDSPHEIGAAVADWVKTIDDPVARRREWRPAIWSRRRRAHRAAGGRSCRGSDPAPAVEFVDIDVRGVRVRCGADGCAARRARCQPMIAVVAGHRAAERHGTVFASPTSVSPTGAAAIGRRSYFWLCSCGVPSHASSAGRTAEESG